MYDLYKPFRNYLRQFPLVQSLDLIWAYSEHVANNRTLPARMQFRNAFGRPWLGRFCVYPWELDLLAREIILNGNIDGKRSLDTWAELSTVINKLRSIDDEMAKRDGSPEKALRDLHRTAHQQFPWQRPPSISSMMRAYKLFGTDMMRPILEEITDIDLDSFFKLGLATAGHFLKQPGLNTNQDYTVIGVEKETSEKFFDRLTVDLKELREQIIAAQRYDDGWLYTINPLRNRPLVRFDSSHPERVLCPIQTFLMRRFSEGLFYDTVVHPNFPNAVGKSFEAYIGDVLHELLGEKFSVHGEREYWVGKNRKDGVDWIVSDETSHIFIECKTKRLRHEAKFISDGVGLAMALDTMAGYIVQNYLNIMDALAGRTHWERDEKPIYSIIVTLEDWWIFSPPIIKIIDASIHTKMAKAGVPLKMLEEVPYIIASADEFEAAFQIMSGTGIAAYLGLKCTEEHRQQALSGFSTERFSEQLKATHRRLFEKDWRKIAIPS
jgi:hypothetical protein